MREENGVRSEKGRRKWWNGSCYSIRLLNWKTNTWILKTHRWSKISYHHTTVMRELLNLLPHTWQRVLDPVLRNLAVCMALHRCWDLGLRNLAVVVDVPSQRQRQSSISKF
jgi:hypothetical protein